MILIALYIDIIAITLMSVSAPSMHQYDDMSMMGVSTLLEEEKTHRKPAFPGGWSYLFIYGIHCTSKSMMRRYCSFDWLVCLFCLI